MTPWPNSLPSPYPQETPFYLSHSLTLTFHRSLTFKTNLANTIQPDLVVKRSTPSYLTPKPREGARARGGRTDPIEKVHATLGLAARRRWMAPSAETPIDPIHPGTAHVRDFQEPDRVARVPMLVLPSPSTAVR